MLVVYRSIIEKHILYMPAYTDTHTLSRSITQTPCDTAKNLSSLTGAAAAVWIRPPVRQYYTVTTRSVTFSPYYKKKRRNVVIILVYNTPYSRLTKGCYVRSPNRPPIAQEAPKPLLRCFSNRHLRTVIFFEALLSKRH